MRTAAARRGWRGGGSEASGGRCGDVRDFRGGWWVIRRGARIAGGRHGSARGRAGPRAIASRPLPCGPGFPPGVTGGDAEQVAQSPRSPRRSRRTSKMRCRGRFPRWAGPPTTRWQPDGLDLCGLCALVGFVLHRPSRVRATANARRHSRPPDGRRIGPYLRSPWGRAVAPGRGLVPGARRLVYCAS